MMNANVLANLQMLMNIGDGRHAVLAELLHTEKAVIGIWQDPNNHVAEPPRGINLEISTNQTQSTHLPQLAIKAPKTPSTLPENIIALLDQLPPKEKAPLITFAEGLAYHYNNIFMALIGHLSIVMHHIQPSHPSYDRLRECEELIHNTALLIRLLVDVFHRSQSAPHIVYPIDLSDHQINNRIFSNETRRQTADNAAPTKLSIQKVLTIIATIMGRRLSRIFQILQLQTARLFNSGDLQAYAVEHHQAIELHLKRGVAIANDLLDYANAAEIEHRLISLNTIVKDSIAIHQLCNSSLKIKVKCGSTSVCLNGNADLLRRMLSEILANANDAIPHGGEVTIMLRTAKMTASDLLKDPIGSAKAQLLIEDNGPGLPERLGIRAFDPFTTVPRGRKRRGMGLSVVLGIVKAHGGVIRFFNRQKGGLVLIIHLPL